MSWPLSQDYNEAIQDPRTSFSDAELKTGEAVTNALGIPMPRSGNFADVYEVRCPSGSRWAVKCFTRQVSGLRERYSEIGKYLHLANLPFMVDFKYLEQGIRVRGQWYPVLKMQWVEGFVLNEFVRDNLDKKSILQGLGQIWLRMAKRLRESYIAHCDLQHGNVMFVPGSSANSLAVKLIDYDGMCVPSLIGTKSGEVGHPAYQHPERLRTGAYDQEVDRFSLLSIATALRCLAVGGRSLWERYDNGDNLLFRQSDLQAPAESPAFKELLTIGDAQARTLVQELYRACQGPLDVVPLLTDLMPEEKPAGKATKTASVSSSAVAQQPAAAQGPDWDFGDEKAGEATVKKPAGDKIPAGGKIPAWAWGALGGAAAVVLLSVGVGVGLFLHKGSAEKNGTPSAQLKPEPKKSRPQPNDNPAPRPNEFQANLVNEDKKPPQIPASPIPPLQDAVLLMNFDKDTFYQKDGKTYVRDLSGHGNDGLCENVAFTPEGKAGGGLACNGGYLRLRRSLINRLPNYTLMAWIRVEDAQGSDRWIYARTMDQLKNSNYALGTDGGGGLGVAAWNQDHQPDFWVNASPNQSVITKDQWVFVAARLRNGGTSQGDLRLIVDDRPYDLHSQMVKGPEEGTYDFLGVNLKAVLDEVVLCPRSLSDSEIQAIRRQGIEGKSLRPPTRPLLADQTPLADFPRRSWIFQLSPAGDMLAISDEGSKVWRLEEPSTKKLIREFHGHEGAVEAVAFSADGRRAVTSGADKMLRLWDVQTGKMIGTRKVFRGPVVDIALSSDGKKAATAHGTPDADMWNFEENTGGGYHNNRKAVSVAFSPDGRYLACGYDESDKEQDTLLFLWPLFKNGNVLTFRGPAKAVKCIAFSPDGKYIAAGQATPDSVVSLWEMATRRSVRQYRMSKNPIHRLAFSPDSRFLLTSMENRYQVWQVEATGRSVLGGGNIDQDLVTAAFTPDSRGVTFVYRKDDRVIPAQTVRLPTSPESVQVLTPVQAASKDGQKVTVQLRVQGGGNNGEFAELYSEPSWDREGNMFVRFPESTRKKFKDIGIPDVGRHFSHKLVRVSGTVTILRFDAKSFPCIVIDAPDEIKEVPGTAVAGNPPPGPVSQWDKPINPDGDCGFQDSAGKLTIRIPAKPHTIPAWGGRSNSPRMLREVEGDFTAQVRVGGDFEPAAEPTETKFSWIGAGLLLWVDDNTFLRLERAAWYERKPSTLYANWEIRQDGKEKKVGHNYPSLSGAETYLRLERRGKQILAAHSNDGQKWTDVKPLDIELPAKVKIGVLAGSTTSRTFAPTFDRFQLKKGQDAMVRIDNWLTPARPVVVQPPPPPPPPPMRRPRRQPVPDAAAVEAAVKDVRARHKEEYTNNRNQLISVLFKDLNAARNDPPRHFALLRELRDTFAEDNVRGGISQARRMSQDFDVDPMEMQCAALEKSMRSGRSQAVDIVEAGLSLVDEAVGVENYDISARLVKDLRISAAKAKLDAAFGRTAESVLKRAENTKQEHGKLQADLRTLEANPDDAKANLAVGKFHCVARDDWEEGLPLLARGSDAALKSLAEKDLANPDDPDDQVKLGGDWRKQAAAPANSRSLKIACQKRAYHWYQIAAVQLKGPKLKSVQQSMASLAKAVPELQNAWWQFGVYFRPQPTPTADGYLPVRLPHSIVTRQYYRGAIDITVVARSMKTDLNILIGAGGRLIIGQEFNRNGDHLRVFRPDSTPESFGSRAIDKAVTLPANRPFAIRWQIAPAGMKVWLDDDLLFEETHDYDLSSKYPVSIHCNSSPIEVKAAAIRRGPKK